MMAEERPVVARVYSRPILRLRRQLLAGFNIELVGRTLFRRPDAIAGWGHKPTADRARRLAAEKGLPYIAIEDGPLRSIWPGDKEPPLSLVCDRRGIYYDATGPSDLEDLLRDPSRMTDDLRQRARDGIALLRRLRLSKYNHAPDLSLEELGLADIPRERRVLVVDQTAGDSSIPGALATAASFEDMLRAAVAENPGCEIIVKVHPEVTLGAKQGHLADLARSLGLRLCDVSVNPWSLLENVQRVYVVSSQFGFEALMAGCRVTCFGMPFYGGWGLTDDRVTCPRRGRGVDLETVFAALYFQYARYFDPVAGDGCTFGQAVSLLVERRRRGLVDGAS